MKKLIFRELMIASDLEMSAETFQFGPKMNLILGKANKVGKTALCTSLFWAIGCKVAFPPQWDKLSIKTILKFSIGESNYTIIRTKTWIAIKFGDNLIKKYDKVTGDFSRKLSEILGSKAYLKTKSSNYYLPIFPSAQFLPSFIHSDCGWGEIYKSFSDLDAYPSREKIYLTEYFLGIRGESFFNPRKEKSRLERKIQISQEKIGNFDQVMESISKYLLPNPIDRNLRELTYGENIDLLLEDRSFYNKLLVDAKSEKYDLLKQISLLKKAESDLFEDYVFATNNVDKKVSCPTCGIVHENNIVSRFNILDERESLIESRVELEKNLSDLNYQISENKARVEQLSAQILIEEKMLNISPSISGMMSDTNTLSSILNPTMEIMIGREKKIVEESISELTGFPKFRNDAKFKRNMADIKNNFAHELINNLHTLNVIDADEESIKDNPYSKIHVSGSDISRMTLAYFKTLNDFIIQSEPYVTLPMVIDSPIQQEQDEENIETITNFLAKWNDQQLFLFGKDYEEYQILKDLENSHYLEMKVNRRILSVEKYPEVNKLFEDLIVDL